MDALKSTYYVASWFEVRKSGRELILSQFRKQHPDVFAGYDSNINAFFLNTDDDEAISTLRGIFKAHIELYQNGRVGDAPDSPRMVPLKGTIHEADLNGVTNTAQLGRLGTDSLIDVDVDSEESSSESSLSEEFLTCWMPKSGNISILQRDFASSIAEQTGCILCPEPEHKRIRLISGNTQAALAKLQRLEPLLSLLARYGTAPVHQIDHNLLAFSCQTSGTGVCYVPATRQPHADRIMVNEDLAERIEAMYVGEEQLFYVEKGGKYFRAENLDIVHATNAPATNSMIWADYEIDSFGDPRNALPQASSYGNSVVSETSSLRTNDNMGPLEQARVRQWTKTIDALADPTQALSSPAFTEPVAEEPLSVRVIAKSGDSDDDESAKPEVITQRVVAQDSDDEVDGSISALVPRRTQKLLHVAQYPLQSQIGTSDGNAANAKRTTRANRYQADNPAFHVGSPAKPATGLISADAFFADVPRDQGAQGEARFLTMLPLEQSLEGIAGTREKPATPRNKPRRGFGFDGVADEPGREVSHALEQGSRAPPSNLTLSSTSQDRLSSPEQRGKYKPGPGFDPNSYGANRHNRQKDSSRGHDANLNTLLSSANHQNPIPTWPRTPTAPGANPGHQGRGERQNELRSIRNRLIDCSDDEGQQSLGISPPPGLSPPRDLDVPETRQSFHPLDSPLEDIQKPSMKPVWDEVATSTHDETSVSTSNSSEHRPIGSDYSVQTKINKPDITFIRNDRISHLKALQSKKKIKKLPEKPAAQASERIEPDDEVSSRKFYQTMNLRAPNTGKGKKAKGGPSKSNSTVGETAAQKEKRIAKQMAEAWSIPTPARKAQTSTQPAEPEKLSKKAQQAAKSNPNMGRLHTDSLKQDSQANLAREFVERMKRPFELARLFAGNVDFGFQIGQLLVAPTSRIKPSVVYESEKWKSIFDNGVSSAEVYFTNLLTRSGSDPDGILEARARGSKIWNKEIPGRSAVILDFECQDSSGFIFTLHLNLDGAHTIHRDSLVLQQIGVHCPGRTWDTCAVLKGTPVWHNISDTLHASITDLVASVHVRAGDRMEMFFKTPTNNTFIVREVFVRRLSTHDSQLIDEEDLQLKITEIKTLHMISHKTDKRLILCFEKEHSRMAQDERVHYEVSIVDKAINTYFEANKTLHAGEMVSGETYSVCQFNFDRALCITKAALRLVDKIDWVGAHNIGTIVRRQHVRWTREQEAARNIPPSLMSHSFLRPVHNTTGMSIAGPRSVIGAHTVAGTETSRNPTLVPGIRSKTRAQIVTDGKSYFKIGLGGARIPLETHEESSLAADGIVPDDSASQVGSARRQRRQIDERPEGFW